MEKLKLERKLKGNLDNEFGSSNDCEKCGGELGTRMIGDEGYDFCKDCNWITR